MTYIDPVKSCRSPLKREKLCEFCERNIDLSDVDMASSFIDEVTITNGKNFKTGAMFKCSEFIEKKDLK